MYLLYQSFIKFLLESILSTKSVLKSIKSPLIFFIAWIFRILKRNFSLFKINSFLWKSFITKIPDNANLKLVIAMHTDIAMPTVLFNTLVFVPKTKMSNWYILICIQQGVILCRKNMNYLSQNCNWIFQETHKRRIIRSLIHILCVIE